jgi:hypothetical protein
LSSGKDALKTGRGQLKYAEKPNQWCTDHQRLTFRWLYNSLFSCFLTCATICKFIQSLKAVKTAEADKLFADGEVFRIREITIETLNNVVEVDEKVLA